ncbi:integral membrane protein [Streptomyces laurentii]|uniref:Integral membrane protein n=1 Tax=Streptomyces laurentii TaxID=39478 RepID=A0A160P0K1_STRLU|nr:integral membrane protein [Streptomyces laurentii]
MSLGDEHDGQTRTRLPEGNTGDPYGAPRRPTTRSTRSLAVAVGVVVLLIAAIAFANRGNDTPAGSAAPRGGGNDAPAGSAAPTAATGTRPVTGKNGTIAAGFAHDEQGAQSAAANYAVALGSADMFVASSRSAIVRAVYATDAVAAQEGALDKVYGDKGFLSRIGLNEDGSAPSGLTFVSRVLPAGAKIDKYASDRATVSVWYSSLFGMAGEGSQSPVTESWYTNTFELRWTGGDWKVTGFSQKDGPVPAGRDQTASTAEDMADAVGTFGGFTYAR